MRGISRVERDAAEHLRALSSFFFDSIYFPSLLVCLSRDTAKLFAHTITWSFFGDYFFHESSHKGFHCFCHSSSAKASTQQRHSDMKYRFVPSTLKEDAITSIKA